MASAVQTNIGDPFSKEGDDAENGGGQLQKKDGGNAPHELFLLGFMPDAPHGDVHGRRAAQGRTGSGGWLPAPSTCADGAGFVRDGDDDGNQADPGQIDQENFTDKWHGRAPLHIEILKEASAHTRRARTTSDRPTSIARWQRLEKRIFLSGTVDLWRIGR